MSSNELICKILNNIAHLLSEIHDTAAYKQSFLYLHNQIYSFYYLLQLLVDKNPKSIQKQKTYQFIGLLTQLSNILFNIQLYGINSIFIIPLKRIFHLIDEIQKTIIEFSDTLSVNDIKIDNDSKINYQNQIVDLQHIKTILLTLKKSGLIILNNPDADQLATFYLDYINNYFEKHYDEVNDILEKINTPLYISNNEIKQIKVQLSLLKSINIPNDDIKITKKLDSSVISTTYRATRLSTGELLTITEINSNQISKKTWISIYSELVQFSFIKNSFILEIVGASFNEPYRIISRFSEGISLFDLIHNQHFKTTNFISRNQAKIIISDLQLTKIAYQIADGMMFLHSNGITHCDLNTSNVLICDDGIARISNLNLFGLICLDNYDKNEDDNDLLKKNSYALINANYLAPEIFVKKKFSEKSDVYSYGIILWELAMKQIPFNGMSYQSIYEHVVSKKRRLPITFPISDELAKLINSCWDENPDNRPDFSEIVELFKKGVVKFEADSTELSITNDFKSKISLDYKYVELILRNPSNAKFPILVSFLIKNMTNEIHEAVRSIYSLPFHSSSSFLSLFLSSTNDLHFDSLILLVSSILNPDEFPLFIKLCRMNIVHSISKCSSVSLLASFAEFFSKVPDNYFDLVSEFIPQLLDLILSSTTLANVSFSLSSDFNIDNIFYFLHFFSRLDHSKYLNSHKMQIYLYFNCEFIMSIDTQYDLESFAKILPLIEECMTREQVDSVIQILKKKLIAPFSIFEFLLKKMSKDKMNEVIMILLRICLQRDIESSLFDLLHILSDGDFEQLLSNIDIIFEIIQIMIIEKKSMTVALYIFSRLAKLSSMQNYILNSSQFNILNLILDTDVYFELKLEIFTNLYSNEMFCNEIKNNPITSKLTGIILNSFHCASESSIKSILLFILTLSSHQIGCQLLTEQDLLQTFSQVFFLASPNDLSLSLKIIINITNARMKIPQSSLICSCLMSDLLNQSESNIDLILIALRNIIGFSYPCIQEIDLQHSIIPLLSTDYEPKICVLALQLLSACESFNLKNVYAQLTEKIVHFLSSSPFSSLFTDVILSSINALVSISIQFNLKPYLENLKLIQLIDSMIESFKDDFPKIAEQLINLRIRLTS